MYSIPILFHIAVTDSPSGSIFFVLRDKKRLDKKQNPTELERLFFASHKIFRGRLKELRNLESATSHHDAEVMRVMLDGLIAAKDHILRERGYD